jgi:hypothetical protein
MSMPKATIYKNDSSVPRQDDVRLDRRETGRCGDRLPKVPELKFECVRADAFLKGEFIQKKPSRFPASD